MNCTHKYDSIINLPHHVSKTHPRMPVKDRAAQFSPFAALTGFEEVIVESERLTQERKELDEQKQAELNEKTLRLIELLPEKPRVTITCFVPDKVKDGGAYITINGRLKWIDTALGSFTMMDGKEIKMSDISDIIVP